MASKSAKKSLLLLVKVVLTGLVFYWLFARSGFDLGELLDEVRRIRPARFVPWLLLAIAVKLVGIFANIRRWQLLLRGQGLQLKFGFLAASFFVGRFFGIVTPGTLGLDGFKLYDTIRVTRKPVECAAVIAIDKVIGLVSLTALLVVVFPLGWTLLPGLDPRKAVVVGLGMLVASAGFFAVLLAPALTRPVLKIVPGARIKAFAERVFEAATAYSHARRDLLQAVGLAVVGHATTALMYWGILLGLSEGAPKLGLVLFAALTMTAATLVGPTVGGEGIREIVFVKLLAGLVPGPRAFLFGHIGFWIEKGLLGLPGGLIYALRRGEWAGPVRAEDLERVRAEAEAEATGPA